MKRSPESEGRQMSSEISRRDWLKMAGAMIVAVATHRELGIASALANPSDPVPTQPGSTIDSGQVDTQATISQPETQEREAGVYAEVWSPEPFSSVPDADRFIAATRTPDRVIPKLSVVEGVTFDEVTAVLQALGEGVIQTVDESVKNFIIAMRSILNTIPAEARAETQFRMQFSSAEKGSTVSIEYAQANNSSKTTLVEIAQTTNSTQEVKSHEIPSGMTILMCDEKRAKAINKADLRTPNGRKILVEAGKTICVRLLAREKIDGRKKIPFGEIAGIVIVEDDGRLIEVSTERMNLQGNGQTSLSLNKFPRKITLLKGHSYEFYSTSAQTFGGVHISDDEVRSKLIKIGRRLPGSTFERDNDGRTVISTRIFRERKPTEEAQYYVVWVGESQTLALVKKESVGTPVELPNASLPDMDLPEPLREPIQKAAEIPNNPTSKAEKAHLIEKTNGNERIAIRSLLVKEDVRGKATWTCQTEKDMANYVREKSGERKLLVSLRAFLDNPEIVARLDALQAVHEARPESGSMKIILALDINDAALAIRVIEKINNVERVVEVLSVSKEKKLVRLTPMLKPGERMELPSIGISDAEATDDLSVPVVEEEVVEKVTQDLQEKIFAAFGFRPPLGSFVIYMHAKQQAIMANGDKVLHRPLVSIATDMGLVMRRGVRINKPPTDTPPVVSRIEVNTAPPFMTPAPKSAGQNGNLEAQLVSYSERMSPVLAEIIRIADSYTPEIIRNAPGVKRPTLDVPHYSRYKENLQVWRPGTSKKNGINPTNPEWGWMVFDTEPLVVNKPGITATIGLEYSAGTDFTDDAYHSIKFSSDFKRIFSEMCEKLFPDQSNLDIRLMIIGNGRVSNNQSSPEYVEIAQDGESDIPITAFGVSRAGNSVLLKVFDFGSTGYKGKEADERYATESILSALYMLHVYLRDYDMKYSINGTSTLLNDTRIENYKDWEQYFSQLSPKPVNIVSTNGGKTKNFSESTRYITYS